VLTVFAGTLCAWTSDFFAGEGILKKVDVDIKKVLRDQRHIYDLYLEGK
jgi:hypothetical protein